MSSEDALSEVQTGKVAVFSSSAEKHRRYPDTMLAMAE